MINTDKFSKDGYCIVDDFLDYETANQIYNIFESEKNWEVINQVRENHYNHVFKTESPFLPSAEEYYTAKFKRSCNLENEILIKQIFESKFVPFIRSVKDNNLEIFDMRCYKLDAGDHYRTHIDDYAGDFNLIYYVNKEWKWDWGGILNIFSDSEPEFINSIFPKFNRIVLINNKIFRSPHCVTSVESYSKNPRYSIVSFNK